MASTHVYSLSQVHDATPIYLSLHNAGSLLAMCASFLGLESLDRQVATVKRDKARGVVYTAAGNNGKRVIPVPVKARAALKYPDPASLRGTGF